MYMFIKSTLTDPDQLVFILLWCWLGFSTTFTIAIWGRLATLPRKYFGDDISWAVRGRIIFIRLLISGLAVAGVLGTVRLWSLRIIDPSGFSIIALWIGAVFGIAIAYFYREFLFREPKN